MISLLTEPFNYFDYDTNNHINIEKNQNNIEKNQNNIEKNQNYIEKIENNIENKIFNKYNFINECSLNIHCFNPTKNSSPNEWQFRLIKRINSLNKFINED